MPRLEIEIYCWGSIAKGAVISRLDIHCSLVRDIPETSASNAIVFDHESIPSLNLKLFRSATLGLELALDCEMIP